MRRSEGNRGQANDSAWSLAGSGALGQVSGGLISAQVGPGKLLLVPSGLWPSIWVLVIAGSLSGFVWVVGFLTENVYGQESQYLPVFRVPIFTESVIDSHMDYALNSDEHNDVIFFGASATLAGIVPNSFEKATGLRAYNFGTSIEIGPDGHLEIVRAYLAHHPKPRLLVYTAFPRDLGDDHVPNVYFRDRFVQAFGTVLQTREERPPKGFTYYFMQGYWVIRELPKLDGKFPFDAPRGRRPTHHQVAPRLALTRGHAEYPQTQGPVIPAGYLEQSQGIPVSGWYDRSFREMADLAREQDIKLILWIMPVPETPVPVSSELASAWARSFRSDYPEVDIEGLPLQSYEHEFWSNPTHLNRSGAELFTASVAERVLTLLDQQEVG